MWEERHQDKCEDVSEEEGKGGAEDLTDAEAGDDDADIEAIADWWRAGTDGEAGAEDDPEEDGGDACGDDSGEENRREEKDGGADIDERSRGEDDSNDEKEHEEGREVRTFDKGGDGFWEAF